MRAVLVVALVLILLVAGGLLLLRGERAAAPDPEGQDQDHRGGAERSPGLPNGPAEPAAGGETVAPDPEDSAPDRPGLPLGGQVVDEGGRPLAGVEVRARPIRSGSRPDPVRSAEDGRFRFDGLADGHYRVWAKARYRSSNTVRARAGATDLAIVLRGAGEIRALLTGPAEVDGKFPPARVDLFGPDGSIETWEDNEADRGAVFVFDGLAPGEYRLHATVFGAGAGEKSGIAVRVGETTEVTVPIEEATVLTGRVVAAADGAPVAKAFVVVGRGDEPSYALRLTTGRRFSWLNGGVWAWSGEDGRFRIVGLSPGRWSLAAAAPGFDPTVRVVDLPKTGEVELRLPVGAGLVVTVLDREGRPVPEAYVMVGFPVSGGTHTADTDRDGVAQFPSLPPGEVSVHVYRHREWSMGALVEVPAGTTTRKTLRLPPGEALLSGRVTKAGRPEVDRRVTIQSLGLGATWEAATDGDGRFGFDALPAGPARLRVWPTKTLREVEIAPGDNTVEVALPAAGVRLRIVDHQTGRPIGGARVSGARYAHADEEGHIEIEALETVEQTLVVQASGFAPARISFTPAEEKPEVVVRLTRGALLRLSVVDPSGNEIASPWVAVTDADGWNIGGRASDDDAPVFRLAPGTYEVEVEQDGFAPWSAKVEFGESDETVIVTLQPE